jgi:penicillin amidase
MVRFIGLATAVALLISWATGYATNEDASSKGLETHRSVMIMRDDYGIPYVYGQTPKDLFYGFGYAMAQDRLWQAELLRRSGLGTTAELFGTDSIPIDVFARQMFGPAAHRATMFAQADSWTRIILTAYTEGINDWIAKASADAKLPPEFAAFGIEIQPWTVDDVIATFIATNASLSWVGASELENWVVYQSLIARLGDQEGEAVFADTHWLNDPSAPTTIPSAELQVAGVPRHWRTPEDIQQQRWPFAKRTDDAAARLADLLRSRERALQRLGLPTNPNSFGVVIGPVLTFTGTTVLVGGPQAAFTVPQLTFEIGLHGAGFDTVGVSVPGLPFLPVGVGPTTSWTVTTAGTDHWDIFMETLNPANRKQYFFDGGWRELECRIEVIEVAGHDPLREEFCESIHGPIMMTEGDIAFASANAVRGTGLRSLSGWSRFGKAHSYAMFDRLVSRITYNLNILYADRHGNIAYWQTGRIPVRAPDVNPWFPADGRGNSEWLGFVPLSQMPRALNPQQGWMVNWNSKPVANWPNASGGFFDWGPVQRVQRFIKLLEAIVPGSLSLEDVRQLVRDAGEVVDTPSGQSLYVFAPGLLQKLLAAVDIDADQRLPEVVALLSAWDQRQVDIDFDGHYDNPAVALFNTWYATAVQQILDDEIGRIFDETRGGFNIHANLLSRLVDPAPALPLAADYLDGQTISSAITAALLSALDTLADQYGSRRPADWLQPAEEIVWASQGIGNVPNSPYGNRAIYTQIVALGGQDTPTQGINVLPPGQSGDPMSPHFSDQLQAFDNWEYKTMRLNVLDVIHHGEVEWLHVR